MKSQSREKNDPHELNNPIPYSVSALILGLTLWAVSYIFWTSDIIEENIAAEQVVKNSNQAEQVVNITTTPEPTSSPVTKKSAASVDGKAIYSAKCSACHQAMGQGLPGVFPPLDGSTWVTSDNTNLPIQIIAKGLMGKITVAGTEYNGMMPAFSPALSNDELAAVITYIRGSWSNKASAITTGNIAESLAKHNAQKSSWTGEAQLIELIGPAK